MTFDEINKILIPTLMIGVGILIKVVQAAQQTSYRKMWSTFIILGVLLLLAELV